MALGQSDRGMMLNATAIVEQDSFLSLWLQIGAE